MFDKIAEELKAARLKNDMTLKQLSSRTRIDIKFLEAIEEGNFSFLPEIYVKAFIKEYASVVGLNSEIILKKYEAAKEGLPYEEIIEEKHNIEPVKPVEETAKPVVEQKVKPPEEKISEPKETKPPEVKKEETFTQSTPVFDSTYHPPSNIKSVNKNIYLFAGIIGGVIIIAGLIYLIFFNSSSEIIVTEKPYDQVVAESQQRYEEKPPVVADSSQNQVPLSDSLHLVIQTADTSWVKIIIDNSKAEEFILFPNSQKSIFAKNDFRITFGRSSAIKLQLNNKPLEFNPKSKSVSYVLINSNGLQFLEKTPAKGNE